MSRRIVLISITLFCCNLCLSLLPSCKRKGSSSGGNSCTQTTCFIVDGATVTLHDAANHTQITSSSYSIKATDLVLNVNFGGTATVCYDPAMKRETNYSLFSSAYADPAPSVCRINYGNDSIVAYNIYSNNNYDSAHPAGSNLNDIITSDDIPLQPMYNTYYTAGYSCDLNVNALPADTGSHRFTIKLAQKDGDTLTVNTPSISLLK